MKHNVSGNSYRGLRKSQNGAITNINITPFVDVMLVLLVVFMITAPLLSVGVPVELPKSNASSLPSNSEPIVVSIDKQGKIFIQDTEIEENFLAEKLQAISDANFDAKIFVRGDQTLSYGTIMQVMGQISVAGYSKVALVSEFAQ